MRVQLHTPLRLNPTVVITLVKEFVDENGYIISREKSQSSENLLDLASNIGYTIPEAKKEKTMSSVGVSFGRTMSTGKFCSSRIDVSVQLPCENTDEAREKTFQAGLAFCRSKVCEVEETELRSCGKCAE